MAFVFEKKHRPGTLYFGYRDEDGVEHQLRSPYQPEAEGPRALAKARALTQVHADDLEAEAKDIREGRKPRKVEAPFFCEYAKRYEDEDLINLASASATRGRLKNHILPVFGQKRIGAISVADINTFLGERLRGNHSLRGATRKEGHQARKLSAASVAHLRQILQAVFSKAVAEGVLTSNPMDKAMDVEPEERAPSPVTNAEAAAMLAACPDEWRNFLAVGFYTGMRRDNIRRIQVRDVDLDARTITLRKTKNGKALLVRIVDELVPYLRVQLGQVRSVWLFPNPQGGQLSKHIKTAKIFRRAMVRAGIIEGFDHLCRRKGCGYLERRADNFNRPCPRCGYRLYVRPVPPAGARFHDARATFVTQLFRKTRNLDLVSRMVGHRSGPGFTKRHYLLDDDEDDFAQLRGLRFGSGQNSGGITGQGLDRPSVLSGAESAPDARFSIQDGGLQPMRAEGIEPSTYGLRENWGGVNGSLRGVAAGGDASQPIDFPADGGAQEAAPVAQRAHELRRVAGRGLDGAGYVSADEAARMLGVERASVFKLRDEGCFGCVYEGRSVLFIRAEVEAYKKRRGKPRGRRAGGGRS